MAEAAKVKADQIIKENPVGTLSPAPLSSSHIHNQTSIVSTNSLLATAVFSKSYCPYCKAAKTLLSEMGAKPYIVELDQVDDGAQLQDALYEISQQSTVPNIFIRDSGKE
ncbi:hypothetical protein MMC12_007795, partial [Toensbergia leucococca]|nr:hypothetical protein [Toensbergia leucococca]